MGEDLSIPPPDRYLDAVFGAGGMLAKAFPGYRERSGQRALAEAVDAAIVGRRHLLGEAETGTGKSVAYAVPATYHAAKNKSTVVIATANIALQEQLVKKDLPMLRRILPWKFTFALMKGRNHYLCLDRFFGFQAENISSKQQSFGFNEGMRFGGGRASLEDKHHLSIVYEWAEATVHAGKNATGDVSELPIEPPHAIWRQFSVGGDECKKQRCNFKHECYSNAAFKRARSATVIVTNYHLLMAHVSVYLHAGMDLVLPPTVDVIIGDEAHKLPDIARDAMGFGITLESVKRLGKSVARVDNNLGDDIERAGYKFFQILLELKRDRNRYKARISSRSLNEYEVNLWVGLRDLLREAYAQCKRQVDELTDEFELMDGGEDGQPNPEREKKADELLDAEKRAERCFSMKTNLEMALEPIAEDAEAPTHVFFLEEDDKAHITVAGRLLNAGAVLQPGILEKSASIPDLSPPEPKIDVDDNPFALEVPPAIKPNKIVPVTFVATSATLSTGGKFDFIARELGMTGDITTLVATSPFQWASQCLFIVPATMPEPSGDQAVYREAVSQHMERIIALAGGRTLGLFTSRRVLENTHENVSGYCRKQGITLFKQGDFARTELIEKFKKDTRSCLFGTESFWAGVDVPGEACSVVVMDRLPFPTPDDPIADALTETDPKTFFHYNLPRAIIQFKQGFGRLIRSDACRGVVVCLDRRLLDKTYKTRFLKALPKEVPKSTNLDDIVDWLQVHDAVEPAGWDL